MLSKFSNPCLLCVLRLVVIGELGGEFVVRCEREGHLLQPKLGLHGSSLARLHDVRVLVVKTPLVHLAIIDVEASTDLLHSALVACLDVFSRDVLRNDLRFIEAGHSRMQ